MHKYYNILLQQHESTRRHHGAVEFIRSVDNYISLIDISAVGHVQSVCAEVNVELEHNDLYEPWYVLSQPSFPSDRYDRWDGFGNLAFGDSVTQEIWIALSHLEQLLPASTGLLLKWPSSVPARDALLKNFASKTPVNTLICKQTLIDEDFLKNYTQDQKSMVTGDKAVPIQVSKGRKPPRLDLASSHALSLCNKSSILQKKIQNHQFRWCAMTLTYLI